MPTREKINIVWLKRDIRTRDQKALHAAESASLPYLIIYLFEPKLMAYPDTSLRHLQFIYHSIHDFDSKVSKFNRKVDVLHCEAMEAFTFINSKFEIQEVFSYQESGTRITWDRDKTMARYFKSLNITWKQFKKGAVIRGSKNRKGWEKQWYQTMTSPITQNRPAGEDFAWKYLHSFVTDRGKNYARHISKPSKSRVSCGRISPYLAWGNISIKQAVQFINQGYESLKRDYNKKFVEAWKKGQTGFPLVDACMRCLHQTGWINFRMRAMTLSLLCHHLDQDWRSGVYHFAKLFLDYEPGIHYPQFQMQAGTTGTNTVRIYNPIKNSEDHDPDAIFIKKWIPELKNVPLAFIHEPSKMTAMDQTFCGVIIGKDYPLPLVDLKASGKIARDKIWGHRKNATVQSEQQRIIKTHIKLSKKDKLK